MSLNMQLAEIICFVIRYYSFRTYMGIFYTQKARSNLFKFFALLFYYIIATYIPNWGIIGNFAMASVTDSVYGICIFNGSIVGKILLAILFSFLGNTGNYLVAFLFQLSNNSIVMSEPLYILGMILSWCITFFIILFLKKILKPQENRELSKQYWLILVLLASASFLVDSCMFITYMHSTKVADGYYAILVALLMMIITVAIFKIYEHLTDRAELEMKTAVYEQQTNIYKYQITEREHAMQEFRRLRHDMKNHLLYVEELLSENKREDADQYIQNLISNEGLSSLGVVNTGNALIDGLINYKAPYIKDMHIDFNVDINIPWDILIPEENLCIILGNLLDNAIEGTCCLPQQDRKIELSISYKKEAVFIRISNTYEKQRIVKKDGLFHTDKLTANHGIGLSSIERAVEDCGGSLEITTEEKEFKVTVLLPDTEAKKE